jgi:EpsI family protein
MLRFLNSGPVRLVTVLLLAQAALLYSSIRPEAVPPGRPLAEFPKALGDWKLAQEGVVEPEVLEVLKADDLLTRTYVEPAEHEGANLFVASFRSQRNGKAPHSPKNCLPGSGWEPVDSGEMQADFGNGVVIPVNRYVVAHGEERDLVLYWYQSRNRAVANEYKAKFWVVADAIRYNRTDSALVRIIVPVVNKDNARAERTALEFGRASYNTILSFLPS